MRTAIASFRARDPFERKALVSVARSLSNEDIAASLFVSLLTVKTHVNRILGKLDLRGHARLRDRTGSSRRVTVKLLGPGNRLSACVRVGCREKDAPAHVIARDRTPEDGSYPARQSPRLQAGPALERALS